MISKTAIILSGGKNSRMNYENKAFLKIRGESFIEIILKKVSGYKEIIIVSNNPSEYDDLGVRVVQDIIPHQGPLSGIHSGLFYAAYKHALVVPCDMPFVRKDFLEYMGNLSEAYDVVVPKIGGYFQPLCAIYSKNCIKPIEKCLQNNIRKIIDLYPQVKVKVIEEEAIHPFGDVENTFRNINVSKEYDEFCLIERGGL